MGKRGPKPGSVRTHGHSTHTSYSSTYHSWHNMKQRCLNPNNPRWDDYGGRGIYIYGPWIDSFEEFLKDMGERPPNTSLDRIDNDWWYEPGNCRWASNSTQRTNQRKKKES